MLGMQQAPQQSHISQLGHHVPSQHQPLTPSSATSLSCVPVLPPPSRMAAKPKLSLNTSIDNTQPRTFGKGSSLRLDTLSAISPTVRNTFSNAYERQTNSSAQNSGLRFEVDTPKVETPSENQSSAVSSATTSSTLSLESDVCPYTHPAHLKSILANSQYPKTPIRRMSVQRPRFPLRKSVSFREPLQEDITTTKYTLAHSDLAQIVPNSSSESSQSTDLSESSTQSTNNVDDTTVSTTEPSMITHQPQQSEVELQIPSPSTSSSTSLPPENSLARQLLSHSAPPSSTTTLTACPRKQGHKRDSSESGSDSDDSCPQTPIASRSKRHRWAWTLGPLPGYTNGDENEKPVGSREGSVEADEVLPSLSPGVTSPL